MIDDPDYNTMSAHYRSLQVGVAMARLGITTRIVEGLESMFRRAGTSTQGNIYAAQAPSHAGKTTAQKIFMSLKAKQLGGYTENVKEGEDDFDDMPDVSYVTLKGPDGRLTHPVVRIHLQSNPTIKATIKHVARAFTRGAQDLPEFKAKDIENGNMNDVTSFFTAALRKTGVRLIIFDEVQELGKVIGVHRNGAVNLLKSLCKTGHAQLACMGIEGTLDVLASDAQTASLITKRHVFEPLPKPAWRVKTDKDAPDEFIEFLQAMEVQLPFNTPSHLSERDIAEPLWEYCEGVIGVAKTLIMEATDYAIHRDKECLDRLVFSEVCTYEFELGDDINPFYVPETDSAEDVEIEVSA